MACPNRYYKKGMAVVSDRLPGYANGRYLPGDGPGYYCKKSGLACYIEWFENLPEFCEIQKRIGIYCLDCNCKLVKVGDGVIYCPNCKYIV